MNNWRRFMCLLTLSIIITNPWIYAFIVIFLACDVQLIIIDKVIIKLLDNAWKYMYCFELLFLLFHGYFYLSNINTCEILLGIFKRTNDDTCMRTIIIFFLIIVNFWCMLSCLIYLQCTSWNPMVNNCSMSLTFHDILLNVFCAPPGALSLSDNVIQYR